MASNETTAQSSTFSATKVGGFLAGAATSLVLAGLVAVSYGGSGGFGDVSAPPTQVYTNF